MNLVKEWFLRLIKVIFGGLIIILASLIFYCIDLPLIIITLGIYKIYICKHMMNFAAKIFSLQI